MGRVLLAFTLVYVLWGSTYLGIRYAVESIPPFLMAGTRNFVAGLILFAWARLQGHAAPTPIQWRHGATAGVLMLFVGNGGVTWAEQMIPSGVAALLVALVPVWMVLIDWSRPGGRRPGTTVASGLVVGFAGVALLARDSMRGAGAAYGWGVAALLASSIGWSLGSIFNRTANKPVSPFLSVALQMISGGVALLIASVASGELTRFSLAKMTVVSVASWAYLVIAGSLIGYTAYVWLLHVTTPARVATYAYVNPLIAVLLGCTVGHEPFSDELLFAGGLIIAAVVLIVRGGAQKGPAAKLATEVEELA